MESVEAVLPQIANWVGDSGVCEDSDKILPALNDVRLLLWDKGDFENTTEYACYCASECCVTLGSRHKQIRTAWLCGQPIDLRGEWYQASTGLADCCGRICGTHRTITEVGGYHVTFREAACPFYLRIAGEDIQDKGTELVFTVLDTAQKRQTIKLVVGEPYEKIQDATMLSTVLRVVKPKTENRVRVFAFNPYTGEEVLISLYEGSDINPFYKKYKMPSACGEQLIVLSKLKYFPLTNNDELVEFNLNVLIQGLLAIRARSNSDTQKFLDNLNLAVLEANRSMSDSEVKGVTPLKVRCAPKLHSLIPNWMS
jgi:hypothetical protein